MCTFTRGASFFMPAAYDSYDYPTYWKERGYEHDAETIAISEFLKLIPHKIKKVLEIGGGYGRLVPSYLYRSEKVILTDPSAKLLAIARKNLKNKKVQFIQSKVETIATKVPKRSADLIFIVRVLHHITDLDAALSVIKKTSKKNGYLILEFANKMHAKAAFTEFFKGNFTFPLDIFPRDIRSKKSIQEKTLPFINYHPDILLQKLRQKGFTVLQIRSVSNVRSVFLKQLLPHDLLLFIERRFQLPLAKFFFGPSIFILAKNTD